MATDIASVAALISRLKPREAAELVDLVSTEMALKAPSNRWLMIRTNARILSQEPRGDLLGEVLEAVTRVTGIPSSEIEGPRRYYEVVLARHIAMSIYRELSGASTSATGRLFGGRDHSTVTHALPALRARYKSLPAERQIIDRVRAELGLPSWDTPVTKPISTLKLQSTIAA